MNKIYTDRSRVQLALRCRRARYWEYHSGPKQVGIVPKKRSIHLLVGGAVHSGLEVLLTAAMEGRDALSREVEDAAVAAALADLEAAMEFGVELDTLEQPDSAKETPTQLSTVADANLGNGESPIVIDFSDPIFPKND